MVPRGRVCGRKVTLLVQLPCPLAPVRVDSPLRVTQWSRQRRDLRAGEETVDLVVQRPLVGDQLSGQLARPFEQLAVGAQAREAELRKARLARAEQLALAAQLEVLL